MTDDLVILERDGHIMTRDRDGVFVISCAGWPTSWFGRDPITAATLWQGMAHTHDLAGHKAATADVQSLM